MRKKKKLQIIEKLQIVGKKIYLKLKL